MSRRGLAVITGVAIAASAPSYALAFGYDADMQCTNSQLDYSCQKGSRCPSRRQGGRGTDCVDSSSGTQGTCTAFRVCTDMNSGHRQTSRDELQNASPWGLDGSYVGGNNAFNFSDGISVGSDLLSDFSGFDAGGLTDLPGPEMISADTSGGTLDSAFNEPPPESGAPANNEVQLQQGEGVAAKPGSFGQNPTSYPFGDQPTPVPASTDDSQGTSQNASAQNGDTKALTPEQSGEKTPGGDQQGGGGMPAMPGGGQGSGSGAKQAATGFGTQQNQQQKPQQDASANAVIGSQLGQLWSWLTGGSSSGDAAPAAGTTNTDGPHVTITQGPAQTSPVIVTQLQQTAFTPGQLPVF